VNTEVKSLLLEHAFERLRYLRVEFKTDGRNLHSQKALERIGAQREGVLRNHMVVQGDYSRDSVYYSVIDREWEGVKERLASLRNR
jgi:RimJ/RimL family protein N-acetyltransferase